MSTSSVISVQQNSLPLTVRRCFKRDVLRGNYFKLLPYFKLVYILNNGFNRMPRYQLQEVDDYSQYPKHIEILVICDPGDGRPSMEISIQLFFWSNTTIEYDAYLRASVQTFTVSHSFENIDLFSPSTSSPYGYEQRFSQNIYIQRRRQNGGVNEL